MPSSFVNVDCIPFDVPTTEPCISLILLNPPKLGLFVSHSFFCPPKKLTLAKATAMFFI